MEIYIAAGILVLAGAVIGCAVKSVKDWWFYKSIRKESSQRFAAEQKYREEVRLWWFTQTDKIWEQWLKKMKLPPKKIRRGGRVPPPKPWPRPKGYVPAVETYSKFVEELEDFIETCADEPEKQMFEKALWHIKGIERDIYSFCEKFVEAAKRAEGTDGKIKITELVTEAEKILKEIRDGK